MEKILSEGLSVLGIIALILSAFVLVFVLYEMYSDFKYIRKLERMYFKNRRR